MKSIFFLAFASLSAALAVSVQDSVGVSGFLPAARAESTPTVSPAVTPAASPSNDTTGFGPWSMTNITIFMSDASSVDLSYIDLHFTDADPTFGLTTRCSLTALPESPQLLPAGDGRIYVPCSEQTVVAAYNEATNSMEVSKTHGAYAGIPAGGASGSAELTAVPQTKDGGTLIEQLWLAIPVHVQQE